MSQFDLIPPGTVKATEGYKSTYIDERDFGALRLRLVHVVYSGDVLLGNGNLAWRVVYSTGYRERKLHHDAAYFDTEDEAHALYQQLIGVVASCILMPDPYPEDISELRAMVDG